MEFENYPKFQHLQLSFSSRLVMIPSTRDFLEVFCLLPFLLCVYFKHSSRLFCLRLIFVSQVEKVDTGPSITFMTFIQTNGIHLPTIPILQPERRKAKRKIHLDDPRFEKRDFVSKILFSISAPRNNRSFREQNCNFQPMAKIFIAILLFYTESKHELLSCRLTRYFFVSSAA